MTDEEIVARLTAAIPSGNINWSNEDQARQLLPVVRELMGDAFIETYYKPSLVSPE